MNLINSFGGISKWKFVKTVDYPLNTVLAASEMTNLMFPLVITLHLPECHKGKNFALNAVSRLISALATKSQDKPPDSAQDAVIQLISALAIWEGRKETVHFAQNVEDQSPNALVINMITEP